MLVALTKFLTFFKSGKVNTFSHLNAIDISYNFKDNFVREKVNKMASKTVTLNICALEPNYKSNHDDLVLRLKKRFPQSSSKFQSTLVVLILSFP